MKSKCSRNRKHLVTYMLYIICVLFWMYFVFSHLSNYSYYYPTFTNVTHFISRTVITLLVPVIPLSIGIVCLIKGEYRSVRKCCFLFLPLILFSFLRSTSEILYAPTVYSCTTDPQNVGLYDERFDKTLALNPVKYFPSEIPENANHVEYYYYYDYASTETVYVALSWVCDSETDFSQIVSDMENPSYNVYADSYYCNALITDEESLRVAYVICSQNVELPVSMEQVFSFKE